MKEVIKRIPVIGPLLRRVYRGFKPLKPFDNSASYWEDRYKSGGSSGAGSYGKLAEYKAAFLNNFVAEHNIKTIIEHGCGDGNQLQLAEYKSYIGFDISVAAVERCRKMFDDDDSKSFKTNEEYNNEMADVAFSLDVIFHLVEDETYFAYMDRLFGSSDKFVIIYSSDIDEQRGPHERHRAFTEYVKKQFGDWKLTQHIPNEFPYDGNENKGSLSDFYVYGKA